MNNTSPVYSRSKATLTIKRADVPAIEDDVDPRRFSAILLKLAEAVDEQEGESLVEKQEIALDATPRLAVDLLMATAREYMNELSAPDVRLSIQDTIL